MQQDISGPYNYFSLHELLGHAKAQFTIWFIYRDLYIVNHIYLSVVITLYCLS